MLEYAVASAAPLERAGQAAQLAELQSARALAQKRLAHLRELSDTVPRKEIEAAEPQPLHGGVVMETKAADMELVAKPDVLQLHLRDYGKPLDVSKASAKLTLLSGKKQDVTLSAAGNKLEAKGTFRVAAGSKVVAVVTDGGKALGTARFTLK